MGVPGYMNLSSMTGAVSSKVGGQGWFLIFIDDVCIGGSVWYYCMAEWHKTNVSLDRWGIPFNTMYCDWKNDEGKGRYVT
jgi:hypothetical protein